jgi:N utilization substance protein B
MKTVKNNTIGKNFEHKREGRILAFQALYSYEFEHKEPETLITFFEESESSAEARFYAQSLVKGVLDNLSIIDELITSRLKGWDFSRVSMVDKAILRLAIYEMMYEDLEDLIIINEAVEIIKQFGEKESYKFVNGILDAISKRKQNKQPEQQPKVKKKIIRRKN